MIRSEPHIPYTFSSINLMDGRRDRMVFGFTTTYVISAYHYKRENERQHSLLVYTLGSRRFVVWEIDRLFFFNSMEQYFV